MRPRQRPQEERTMKKVSISLLALAAALAISPAAVAGTVVFNDQPIPTGDVQQDFPGNLASFFQVNSPVTVGSRSPP